MIEGPAGGRSFRLPRAGKIDPIHNWLRGEIGVRAVGNAVGVGLVLLFLTIMAFGTIQTAFFPREKTPGEKAQDAAYAAEQEKAKRQEADYRAEREAHQKLVAECLPAGADSLNPKFFSAMLDDCEREARISAAHLRSEEARIKEKWSAPPLYADEEDVEPAQEPTKSAPASDSY